MNEDLSEAATMCINILNNTVTNQAARIKELESEVCKLNFMIEHGLGRDDLKGGSINDVS